MESLSSKMNQGQKSNEKEENMFETKSPNIYTEIMSTIPGRKGCWPVDLYQYEGFWYGRYTIEGILSTQDHFKPQPNSVILSSAPKSGTTWLKALSFSIMTRSHFDESTNPLLTKISHDLVPFIEYQFLSNSQTLDLNVPLSATHISYTSLPKSIINSGCKIVYICRDPKDVFVSLWHHSQKSVTKAREDLHLENAFMYFCEGLSSSGPYWDHVLGYWRASLESPERILFLKYEDLMNDAVYWVKKMAQFMGYPFSFEEEDKGVVQKIINLCSFENMSSLEVNKSGIAEIQLKDMVIRNNIFFRKGKIRDWKNHLTVEMAMQLDQITKQKLNGSGLTLHAA
ncbi:flavonol sulfotransferase-like [Quercus robur]|uniref:flavonol sulfotransferase-like n=1 Tax=Quercus robur TaxID=38942 RepID=UPI0021633B36|nr:flavonol sulfotransferase-like [Quercus robur]